MTGMTNTNRAAAVIGHAVDESYERAVRSGSTTDHVDAFTAQALADDGLLVTDEIQAVLDLSALIRPVVIAHLEDLRMDTSEDEDLRTQILTMATKWATAVDAYLASRAT